MEPSVAISGHQRTCGTVIICGHHHVARRGEYRLEDHRRLELGRDHTMLIGQDALAVSARCDLERPILEGRRVDGNRDGDMSRCELVRRVRRRILEQVKSSQVKSSQVKSSWNRLKPAHQRDNQMQSMAIKRLTGT